MIAYNNHIVNNIHTKHIGGFKMLAQNNKEIIELVKRLEEFGYDFDPYLGLTDEEKEKSNREIAASLEEGDTESLEEWFVECLDTLEPDDRLYNEAELLLQEIRKYRR
jgi:hypothetical protein